MENIVVFDLKWKKEMVVFDNIFYKWYECYWKELYVIFFCKLSKYVCFFMFINSKEVYLWIWDCNVIFFLIELISYNFYDVSKIVVE